MEVGCGGLEKLASASASLSGIGVRSDPDAMGTTGIMCFFADQSRKMLGNWNWFELSQRDGGSNITWEGFLQTAMWDALGVSILNVDVMTSTIEPNRLCDIWLRTSNGQFTSIFNKYWSNCWDDSRFRGNPQRQSYSSLVGSSVLVDVKAWVTRKENKLYAVSFGFIKYSDFQVNSITYKDLQSQPGPLPAYDLGILWDNQKSSVGGEMSTTVSFKTMQKVSVTTSTTVGNTVEQSFTGVPYIPKLMVPECSKECKWSNSSTTVNSQSSSVEQLIEVTPKLSVRPGDYSTLSNYMYNGTAELPYVASATIRNNDGNAAILSFPGSVTIDGSLTYYSIGGRNQPAMTDEERNAARKKTTAWKRTVISNSPSRGYPHSQPLVYNVPYFEIGDGLNDHLGPNPTFRPSTAQVCGDSMSWGGVKKIKALWTKFNSRTYITGFRLYTPNGKELCSNFGTNAPDGWPQNSGEFTFNAGEVILEWMLRRVDAFNPFFRYMEMTTNQNRKFTIGEFGSDNTEIAWLSSSAVASGVLDGFVFNMHKAPTWSGPNTQLVSGIGPIFLQPYRRLEVQLVDMPSPPVSLPNAVQTFVLQKVSSTNIKVQWSSVTQVDTGKTTKDSWSYVTKKMKFKIPKIPLDIGMEKLMLNLDFKNVRDDLEVVGILKLYNEAVNLPYNGFVAMEFGSGYTMKWPITGDMKAQDGRYAVFQTTDRKTKRLTAQASSASAANGADDGEGDSLLCGGYTPRTLLKLPMHHRAKHSALAWYTVTAEDISWTNVSDRFLSSVSLLSSLNSQLLITDAADGQKRLPDISSMVGQKVLVCTA
eukprot:gene7137-7352_t